MCSFPIPLDIIVKYPCLQISQAGTSLTYSGPLIVKGYIYNLSVVEHSIGSGQKFQLTVLNNSLGQTLTDILNKMSVINSESIISYLNILCDMIEDSNPPLRNCSTKYHKVASEFREFAEFYIDLKLLELSPDFSTIRVSFMDQANREHYLEFGIDYEEYSNIFFFKEFDVPKKENSFLYKKSSNLKELYNLFLTYIDELQLFFEFMDLIDAHSTVLDPKDLKRKYDHRRILLEKNFSVIITVDPTNVNCCPNFSFVGAEKLIGKYQYRLKENLSAWNEQTHLFEQLLLSLGLSEFPKEKEVVRTLGVHDNLLLSENECCICFASDVNGFLPDIVCGNKSCGNVYHRFCLHKWLTSIESRKYFSDLQGPCPNCEKTISCPIDT